MKKRSIFILCAASLLPLAAEAQDITVKASDGVNVEVTYYSPSIVRVVKYPSGSTKSNYKSLVVVKQPEKVSLKKGNGTASSSVLTTAVDKDGRVTFSDAQGTLLKEKSVKFEPIDSGSDKGAWHIKQTFTLDDGEAIYGLGTMQDGALDRRGMHLFMEQNNTVDYQLTMQSIKGWGLYFDNYSRSKFDDSADGMMFSFEVGKEEDYYFVYGDRSMRKTTASLRELTGQAPMFPLWTFGYWQSRERYENQQQLMEVVDKYRELQVPLDGIVQDWQYWGGNYLWNAMDFLSPDFSDAKGMIDHVHKQNAHIMITIWASFGPATIPYKELKEKGLLFNFDTWPQSGISHVWPPRADYPSGVRVYMPYSQTAKDIYWKNLKRLFDYGIDAWWMDSTDPDMFNATDADYDMLTPERSFRSMRNAFPLATVSGVYENQRKTSSNKRVFIMTRSAFAGQQRYGSNMWSGDVAAAWDVLRGQLPAGLNFTLTGDPNFNTDIGGFFCGAYNFEGWGTGSAVRNPQYQELYVRWLQYGLFTPVFRSHGTEAPREIYQFGKRGEPVFDAIEKCIRLRYQLLPYIYSLAWQVTNENDSYMMPLAADFAADKRTHNLADEMMFGHSILAAPILKAQYTKEQVNKVDAMSGWDRKDGASKTVEKADFTQGKTITKYLPAGAQWYEYESNKLYDGGQDVTLNTRLDYIPMFIKAGSILPLAPVMQYAAEKKWNDLEIKVYPGADATFTLYEDEGDNYNYEKGKYSTITFQWNDKKQQLTIDARKGAFDGMLQKRVFRVSLPGKAAKKVDYSGKKVNVSL